MVRIFSITAASSFSVGLIKDDWTGFSSSVALKDDSVPSAGVQDRRIRSNWQVTVILPLVNLRYLGSVAFLLNCYFFAQFS